MTDNGGVWVDTFSSGQLDDLDKGLSRILQLQATRAQALLDEEEPPDLSYKDRVRREERIDRNLDKLYKNALAFRNAKAPRAVAGASKVIDENGNDQGNALPMAASPSLMAEALRELESIGIPRENITRRDVLDHLAQQNKIAIPAGPRDDIDEVF